MHRGSTPTLVFEFDRDISNLDYLEIDFSQDEQVILRKFRHNCRIDKNIISIYLSENETLKFKTFDGYNAYVEVQIKIGIVNKRLITDIMQVIIKPILQDGRMDVDVDESPLSAPVISVRGNKIVALIQQDPVDIKTYTEKETTVLASALDKNLDSKNIRKGVTIFGVEGKIDAKIAQDKKLKVTKNGDMQIKPDLGYNCIGSVDLRVDVKPDLDIIQVNTTENGLKTVKPAPGKDGIAEVYISTDVRPKLQKKVATSNGLVEADEGYYGLKSVDVEVPGKVPKLQKKTVEINGNGTRAINPDGGYDGLQSVSVITEVIPELEHKTINITQNGRQEVTPSASKEGISSITIQANVKPSLQEKTATSNGTVRADPGYDGLSKVDVKVPNEVRLQEKTATKNGPVVSDVGYDGLSRVNVDVTPNLQSKRVTKNGLVIADGEYDGLSRVDVQVLPELQEKAVVKNGTVKPDPGYDGLSAVNVNVEPKLQTKKATVNGRVAPDSGYDGLQYVDVQVDKQANVAPKTVYINGNGTKILNAADDGHDGYSSVEINTNVYVPEIAETANFVARNKHNVFNVDDDPVIRGKAGMKQAVVDVKVEPKKTITKNGVYTTREGTVGIEAVDVNVSEITDFLNGEGTKYSHYGTIVSVLSDIDNPFVTNWHFNELFQLRDKDPLKITTGYTIARNSVVDNMILQNDFHLYPVMASLQTKNVRGEIGSLDCALYDAYTGTSYDDDIIYDSSIEESADLHIKEAQNVHNIINGIQYSNNAYLKIKIDTPLSVFTNSQPEIQHNVVTMPESSSVLSLKTLDLDFSTTVPFNLCGSVTYGKIVNFILRNPTKLNINPIKKVPPFDNIFVPDSLVSEYKADPNYSLVSNKIKPLSEFKG